MKVWEALLIYNVFAKSDYNKVCILMIPKAYLSEFSRSQRVNEYPLPV